MNGILNRHKEYRCHPFPNPKTMNFRRAYPGLSKHIGLTSFILAILSSTFGLYVYTEKKIDQANEQRQRSYLLADQLRQSSDDLTRMVRTYVMTEDPRYKKYYQDILAIRNGDIPQPDDYFYVYWDLVIAKHLPEPSQTGNGIALLDRMRQSGFTAEELDKLAQAKALSDTLVLLELEALTLLESKGPDAEAQRLKARQRLFDADYHAAKASLMQPINEVYRLADQRTQAAVHQAQRTALIFRWVFIFTVLGTLFLLARAYKSLIKILGAPAEEILAHMRRIAEGDLASPITVPRGLQTSVLAGLAEMQSRLHEHEMARKKNRGGFADCGRHL